MQHVLEVASLSPPGATNATKPAVNAAKVSKGESFDLLLSKASGNIQNEERKNDELATRTNSTKVQPAVSPSKDEKTYETGRKKEIKNSKSKDTEEKDETSTDNAETMVAVLSNGQDVDKQPITDQSGEISDQKIEDLNLIGQNTATIDQALKTAKPNQENNFTMNAEIDQVSSAENLTQQKNVDQNAKDPSSLESEAKIVEGYLLEEKQVTSFSSQPSSDAMKEKQEGNFAQNKSAADMKNLEKSASFSEAVSTKAENSEEVLTQKQDLASSAKIPGSDEEKLQAVSQKQATGSDSAPPGKSMNQDGVITNNTQVSQSHEPARLAEAPKAETISQISNQIESMVKANRSSIRVQLYPEELGHIDLRIVSSRNGIGVTMVADKSTTQEVLRSEMNLLKQSIEQAGIQLSDLNIGQGQNSGQQQLAEEQRGQYKFSFKSGETNNQELDGKTKNVILQTSVVDYKV